MIEIKNMTEQEQWDWADGIEEKYNKKFNAESFLTEINEVFAGEEDHYLRHELLRYAANYLNETNIIPFGESYLYTYNSNNQQTSKEKGFVKVEKETEKAILVVFEIEGKNSVVKNWFPKTVVNIDTDKIEVKNNFIKKTSLQGIYSI